MRPSDGTTPHASVVVAARDAASTLPRTLACLAAQCGAPEFEVIVVDDGSRDDTAALAERAGVRLLRGSGEGSSAARNAGVAVARGELLAFTDADCFPSPGWLAAGAKRMHGVDLVCGTVKPDPESALGPFDRTVWVERETGLYETANLLIRRELFERVGGFETWLRDRGPRRGWTNAELGEDVWLGWRARRAGARSAFEPAAVVYHAVHQRDAGGYVSERRRVRHFPAMVARVPELRGQFMHRGVFLSRRSALFDVAVAGVVLAGLTRSKAPLLAAAPYVGHIARRSRVYRRRAPVVAAVDVVADAVALGALAYGSARNRSLVI